ncbi:hypothetical protein NVV93_06095 [Pseudomonas sp. LS44]|uniref:hypothetical protein n=1 Tax=Pseudomonas sp. LS44 TaxID=1357074 RepID=UPI00215B1295|nr:hypothetical protein [Pseudomonas sp. LS44]UVE18957.1 hypothetical protein NVV93_06095 [Pseudomonas sp. LS44]
MMRDSAHLRAPLRHIQVGRQGTAGAELKPPEGARTSTTSAPEAAVMGDEKTVPEEQDPDLIENLPDDVVGNLEKQAPIPDPGPM